MWQFVLFVPGCIPETLVSPRCTLEMLRSSQQNSVVTPSLVKKLLKPDTPYNFPHLFDMSGMQPSRKLYPKIPPRPNFLPAGVHPIRDYGHPGEATRHDAWTGLGIPEKCIDPLSLVQTGDKKACHVAIFIHSPSFRRDKRGKWMKSRFDKLLCLPYEPGIRGILNFSLLLGLTIAKFCSFFVLRVKSASGGACFNIKFPWR